MSEVINNTPDVEEVTSIDDIEFILPDDYVEEEETDSDDTEQEVIDSEEQSEEVQEVQEPQEQQEETQEPFDWSSLPLKHLQDNKKLSDFTPEEATELLQTGMDYKRVREQRDKWETQYNELQNDPMFGLGKEIAELAELSGFQPDKYVDAIRNQVFEQIAMQKGTTADIEREAYNLKQEKQRIQSEKNEIDQFKQTQQSESQKNAMYDRFFQALPEFKNPDNASKITQETWDLVSQGMDLTQAYSSQVAREKDAVIQQLQQQLKQQEQNTKNVKAAPVKGVGNSGSDDPAQDDFLDGLLGN